VFLDCHERLGHFVGNFLIESKISTFLILITPAHYGPTPVPSVTVRYWRKAETLTATIGWNSNAELANDWISGWNTALNGVAVVFENLIGLCLWFVSGQVCVGQDFCLGRFVWISVWAGFVSRQVCFQVCCCSFNRQNEIRKQKRGFVFWCLVWV
jgi:hypothetical protein